MQDDQYKLYVATSKKETIAKEVLEYFDLTNYFTGIYGSLDTRFTKESIIKACLIRENCKPKETLMIGDTVYDLICAHTNQIKAVGVLWGFGTRQELQDVEATALVKTPFDLLQANKRA